MITFSAQPLCTLRLSGEWRFVFTADLIFYHFFCTKTKNKWREPHLVKVLHSKHLMLHQIFIFFISLTA